MRLDFYGKAVCLDNYENVAGVICIAQENDVCAPVSSCFIKDVELSGPDVASVVYVPSDAPGQLWSGRMEYNPDTRSITFYKGKVLSGDSVACGSDAGWSCARQASGMVFDFVSKHPNYKNIPPYYVVQTLPDRVYYRNIVADETVAPPFGDVQLRCYYPGDDKDVNITNEVGESPLGPRFNATIIDCWPLPDETGLMAIIWTGLHGGQEFTFYRVDNDNRFKEVDYTVGFRAGSFHNTGKAVEQSEIASMSREGDTVKVYDPSVPETRMYDLAGRRL